MCARCLGSSALLLITRCCVCERRITRWPITERWALWGRRVESLAGRRDHRSAQSTLRLRAQRCDRIWATPGQGRCVSGHRSQEPKSRGLERAWMASIRVLVLGAWRAGPDARALCCTQRDFMRTALASGPPVVAVAVLARAAPHQAPLHALVTGAGQDVGRSCVVVRLGGKTIMFDCGMHIGHSDHRRFPDFALLSRSGRFTEALDALFITHFHLDHLGALPYFTQAGGPGLGAWWRAQAAGVPRQPGTTAPSGWLNVSSPHHPAHAGAGVPGAGVHDAPHARHHAHHARGLPPREPPPCALCMCLGGRCPETLSLQDEHVRPCISATTQHQHGWLDPPPPSNSDHGCLARSWRTGRAQAQCTPPMTSAPPWPMSPAWTCTRPSRCPAAATPPSHGRWSPGGQCGRVLPHLALQTRLLLWFGLPVRRSATASR